MNFYIYFFTLLAVKPFTDITQFFLILSQVLLQIHHYFHLIISFLKTLAIIYLNFDLLIINIQYLLHVFLLSIWVYLSIHVIILFLLHFHVLVNCLINQEFNSLYPQDDFLNLHWLKSIPVFVPLYFYSLLSKE